ncbi:MAG: F1F0 ATPase subunit 2 [Alphaproteobacteria bacterium]|jgi:F1F0 ATPase subunit 2
MNTFSLIDSAAYLAAGAALGAAYFALLYRTVCLHGAQVSALKTVLLFMLRLGAAVIVFWVIAQQGAAPLLWSALGFFLSRLLALRLAGRMS